MCSIDQDLVDTRFVRGVEPSFPPVVIRFASKAVHRSEESVIAVCEGIGTSSRSAPLATARHKMTGQAINPALKDLLQFVANQADSLGCGAAK